MLFFLFLFCLGGPKLLQLQNLGDCFVVFFLGDQNRNFEKVKGLKLQSSLFFIYSKYRYMDITKLVIKLKKIIN